MSRRLSILIAAIVAVLCVITSITANAPSAAATVSDVMIAQQRLEADTQQHVSEKVAKALTQPLDTTHRMPVFAHRGFVEDDMVENSFESFDAALDQDCPQIELDIRTSKDGVYYISHDASLNKVAGIDKRVDNMTSGELDRVVMKNGEHFHRLSSLFDHYGTGMYYLIEFKEPNASASAFYNVMAQYPEVATHVEVQTFYANVLEELEGVLPAMYKQLLVGHLSTLTEHLDEAYIDSFAVAKHMATPTNIARIHNAGKEIWSWTVEKQSVMRKELNEGVDGVVTDLETAAQIAQDVTGQRGIGVKTTQSKE